VEVRTLVAELETPRTIRVEIPKEIVEVRQDVQVTLEVEPPVPPRLVLADPVSVRIPPPEFKRRDWSLSHQGRVQTSGIQYLKTGEVTTSAAPLVVASASKLQGASISVDVPDSSREYVLEVLVNSVVEESLTLVSGSTTATTFTFTTDLVTGDELSVRLRLVSGTGRSDFRRISATLEISEK
jgi:hypothetical protein